MYKVLIIASTDYMTRFKNDFEMSGLQFDYLVTYGLATYDFGKFKDQYVSVDHEMLPLSDENQQMTRSQVQKKKELEQQINQLGHILFQNFKFSRCKNLPKKTMNNETMSSQVFQIDQINDLKINEKDKKIFLEVKQAGVLSYDHVFFEESFLNFSSFNDKFKNQNLVKSKTSQVFQFVGMKFKINENLGSFKYWLMTDSEYNSIYDNFYFISTSENMIDVWCWIPAQQLKNPTTSKYFTARVQRHIENKMGFLNFQLVSENFILQPLNTYMPVDLQYESLVSLMPHFHFYSPLQVTETIFALTDLAIKKLKIKKEFIQKNQVEGSL